MKYPELLELHLELISTAYKIAGGLFYSNRKSNKNNDPLSYAIHHLSVL